MRRSRQPGPLNPIRTWSLDLGAGGDSNTVPATITKAEYEWIDGTAISGTLNMSAAVSVWAVFRCQGILTISGTIDGDGDGGAGGAAGAASGDGGIGAGPGRGVQGFGQGGGGADMHGGRRRHARRGCLGGPSPYGSWSYGGEIYDSLGAILAQSYGTWCAGSGGGGGGANAGNAGGAGGNGGAGIIIVARQVVLTGTITADGTNGSAGAGTAGDGGGGSGGLVIILAEQINCTGGTITATAGGGTVAGGTGRIYLCYTKGLVSSGTCTPTAVTIDLRAPASAG